MEYGDYVQRYWDSVMCGMPPPQSNTELTREAQDLINYMAHLNRSGPLAFRPISYTEGMRVRSLLEKMNAMRDHFPNDMLPLQIKADLSDVLFRTGNLGSSPWAMDDLQMLKFYELVSIRKPKSTISGWTLAMDEVDAQLTATRFVLKI